MAVVEGWFAAGPKPRRGGAPHEVILHVSAETLAGTPAPEALVAPDATVFAEGAKSVGVSAETSSGASAVGSLMASEVALFVEVAGGLGVSSETARRLCCDASVSAVLEDGRGEVLDVGRKRRTVPAAIARALEAREGRVCGFPGCTHTLFVEKHHIQHWADGGSTSLDNLCQLCRHHHTFVHEHGWGVERTKEGLKFTTPRGRVVIAAPEPPTMTQGALQTMVADAGLEREDVSLRTEGWGDPVDYVQVVDALLRETLLERSATMVALARAKAAAG